MGAIAREQPTTKTQSMQIAFVDESGDIGGKGSPTRLFLLCAVVVDHRHWRAANAELRAMRERLEAGLGLRADAEIHASEFLSKHPRHLGLDNRRRYLCVRHILRTLATLPGIRFRRAAVWKGEDPTLTLEAAWSTLLSEIAQSPTLTTPGCPSRGLVVVCDHHSERPFRPSEGLRSAQPPDTEFLDLPYGRDSADSGILQMADLLAYLSKQSLEPNPCFAGSNGRALLRLSEPLFGKGCAILEISK
jgi:hypothetical protein